MRENTINVYECADGHQTITIDLVEGTTPMILNCRYKNCGKLSHSKWYRVPQDLKPEYEWYKPDNLKKLNPQERYHVEQGGLLIRKIKQTTDAKV